MNARDELGISRWPTSAVRAAAAWRSNSRSVRIGIVPLFQVYPVFVPLFSLHRSFPGLIGLIFFQSVCRRGSSFGFSLLMQLLLKGPNATVQHGARAQLTRGKLRMLTTLWLEAGKVRPLPGPR